MIFAGDFPPAFSGRERPSEKYTAVYFSDDARRSPDVSFFLSDHRETKQKKDESALFPFSGTELHIVLPG